MMAGIITNKKYGISPNTNIKIHSVSRESGDWYNQLNWINSYGLHPGIISISTGTDLISKNNISLNDVKELMIDMTSKGFVFIISSELKPLLTRISKIELKVNLNINRYI